MLFWVGFTRLRGHFGFRVGFMGLRVHNIPLGFYLSLFPGVFHSRTRAAQAQGHADAEAGDERRGGVENDQPSAASLGVTLRPFSNGAACVLSLRVFRIFRVSGVCLKI